MKIGIWALALAAVGAAASPEKAVPRVIFHTIAGDLVFALYPTVAPKTVAQFLELNRRGVYDTTHFRRLEPGFVLQTGTADDRIIPLSVEQKALIRKLPGEYAPEVRHRRGILSLAKPDNDPDGGETSFSILLGDAPHLDGKYTIFGELERGADVLDALERVALHNGTPSLRLTINQGEVVETLEALRDKPLRSAISLSPPPSQGAWKGLWTIVALLSLTMAAAAIWGKGLRPVLLLGALIGGFTLFFYLTPLSAGHPWLAAAIFLGLVVLFRALSLFESPARRPTKAQ